MTKALYAFDVSTGGGARSIPLTEAASEPPAGVAYRWLHFDVLTPGLADWLQAILPPMAIDTLMQAETRPRSDDLESGLAVNLRGVNLNPESKSEDMVSLRIWVQDRLVVTTRVRQVMTIIAIAKRFEALSAPETIGGFLASVADGLTDRTETVTLSLEDETDTAEEAEIAGVPVSADDVARLRRAVIMMRRFAGPQREALGRLSSAPRAPFSEAERLSMREITNRTARNAEALESLRERLAILQDHIDARAAEGMTRNSYVLGLAAAIFLPLGFLTGLFGVNVAGMPGVEEPSAFWWLSAAMIVIGLALTAVFRWMRWF